MCTERSARVRSVKVEFSRNENYLVCHQSGSEGIASNTYTICVHHADTRDRDYFFSDSESLRSCEVEPVNESDRRSPYPQWQESQLSQMISSVQLIAKQKYYHKLSICAILSIPSGCDKAFRQHPTQSLLRIRLVETKKRRREKLNLFIDCSYPHHIGRRARRPRLDWIFSDVYTKFLIRHIQFCFIALAHKLLIHIYLIHLLNDVIACSSQIGRCLIDPSDTMRCVISVIKVSHFEMN